MSKGRLEAFSDGVIAILITIMVLELRPPHGEEEIKHLIPVLVAYVLSFIYIAIYWNNHHHLLHAAAVINGRVLWANMHLLFWLSLIPFGTAWMDESFDPLPTGIYGAILLAAAVAYTLLVVELRRVPGQAEAVMVASGSDRKGLLSMTLYAIAIPVALVLDWPWVSVALYAAVAALWFIPDRRIEHMLKR